MKQTTPQRGFRVNPVAAGCAVLLMAAGAAQAQQAADNVIVTGIRASIESAISVKKNAEGVVEAVSAEDIGKLPDATVAESIARLPGVTAQRDAATGRAKNVSVRGMSPDFNGATLNGRGQASTGDSRGVEFDQFPAELLGSIVIHKTPNASLVDQGLASTIDMKTVRPLDFNKRTMVVNLRKQSTGIDSGSPTNGSGDRQSFSYIDQFADRTIGVVLGYSKQKDIGAVQSDFGSWGTATKKDPVTGQDVVVPNGFNDFNKTTSANREGLMATVQFKPNKDFETSLDLFTSKNSFSAKTTGIQGALPGGAGGYDPDGVLSNATISNGVATSGTYNNFKGVVRNDNTQGDDKLNSIGWNTKFKLGEWKTAADLGRSEVTRQHTRFETTAGQAGNATALDTISWTGFDGKNLSGAKYTTGFNYADRNVAKLTDVEGWGGGASTPQAGYYASPTTKDKVDNLRLSGARNLDMGMLTAVEVGLHLSNRDKTRTTAEGAVVIPGGDPYGAVTMPGSATATALATGINVAAFDPVGTVGSLYQLTPWTSTAILNKNFKINEKVTTTYIKGDLEGKLMGLSFTGNVGGQLVSSNQTSTGFNIDGDACAGEKNQPSCTYSTVTQNHKYNDFNPSLNLNFDVGNDQVVRVGAAKVLSRANMIDMAGNLDLTFNTGADSSKPAGWNGSGGNPKLEPFRAKSFDLSYEKYFGKKGYVSVAGFYKALDTYIVRQSTVVDFRNFITNPAAYGTTLGTMTTPVNGSGGSISGMELSVNVPFSMLTPAMDGFGLMANTSATQSAVSLPRAGLTSADTDKATSLPLPGLSKNVTNLRAYYEKNGFSVSLGAKKRSDFLGEILDYQDNRQLTFVKGETLVDLQAGYEFNTGPLKGLSILLQGNNLTNAEFIRYNGTPDNVVQRTKFGKTYQIGMNYKF